jgi:hypothetical protein
LVLFLLLLRLLVDFPRGGGGGGGAEVAVYSWKRKCSRRCSRRAEKSFETTTTVSFETLLLFVYFMCRAWAAETEEGSFVWRQTQKKERKFLKNASSWREQRQHFSFALLFVAKAIYKPNHRTLVEGKRETMSSR